MSQPVDLITPKMKVVSEAINTLRKKGILIFVISHDLEFLIKSSN